MANNPGYARGCGRNLEILFGGSWYSVGEFGVGISYAWNSIVNYIVNDDDSILKSVRMYFT